MLNDTKHLSVQSFQRNQGLLEALNNYLIYLKLSSKGIDSNYKPEKISESKERILSFLNQLNDVVSKDEKIEAPGTRLLGLDTRFKSLVNQFTEAKGRKRRYKSILFRQNPTAVIKMMSEKEVANPKELIESLTELGNLIEDHLSLDTKDVIGDI